MSKRRNKRQQAAKKGNPLSTEKPDIEDEENSLGDHVEKQGVEKLKQTNKTEKEDDQQDSDSDKNNEETHEDTQQVTEKEEVEEEPKKEKLTKQQERILNKQRKAGKISREEYEKAMGIFEPEMTPPTEEEMQKVLKAQEYVSGLIGIKEKKGVVDSQAKDIKIEAFTLAYESTVLLRDADLTVAHGRKYGVIGPNGTGKSTLLRHISQRHLPIQDHIQILHVEQEIEGTDQIALDAVVEADEERMSLMKELETLTPLSEKNTEEGLKAHERVIDVHKRLRTIGAHSAEARASSILAGLQFTTEMQKRRTKEFSGGWRMRIALARALFVLPDLLLLDEPTNHLDLDAVIWLEAYLKRYKKTLLLVSHDRNFLNGVVTDIICLSDQKLIYYKGNYDSYERGEVQKKKTTRKTTQNSEKKTRRLERKTN